MTQPLNTYYRNVGEVRIEKCELRKGGVHPAPSISTGGDVRQRAVWGGNRPPKWANSTFKTPVYATTGSIHLLDVGLGWRVWAARNEMALGRKTG